MKKTLCSLLAICGVSLATAASVSNDDYTYSNSGAAFELSDAGVFTEGGDFALLLDFGCPLKDAGNVDFEFNFAEEGLSAHVDFSYMPDFGMMTFSANGKLDFKTGITIDASVLLLQINGLYATDTEPTVSLSYYDDNKQLSEIWTATIQKSQTAEGGEALPTTIKTANVKVTAPSLPMTEEAGIGITTWQGEVTPEDIEEPTYVEPSSPSVPEPATATLSLLALCGLAARRRRK